MKRAMSQKRLTTKTEIIESEKTLRCNTEVNGNFKQKQQNNVTSVTGDSIAIDTER